MSRVRTWVSSGSTDADAGALLGREQLLGGPAAGRDSNVPTLSAAGRCPWKAGLSGAVLCAPAGELGCRVLWPVLAAMVPHDPCTAGTCQYEAWGWVCCCTAQPRAQSRHHVRRGLTMGWATAPCPACLGWGPWRSPPAASSSKACVTCLMLMLSWGTHLDCASYLNSPA